MSLGHANVSTFAVSFTSIVMATCTLQALQYMQMSSILCALQLVGAGRHVVATSHKADKLEQAFAGETAKGPGHLYFENSVDITDSAALMSKELWQGISQVVTTVGPAFGRQPDGGMG